jgi:exopolyphosphatase/guanosine-5'-triphosphate,3'-diphosphate pyrophosphatase
MPFEPAPSVDRASPDRQHWDRAPLQRQRRAYAALDLGTNNCRLLIARPTRGGF